jgi:hypothetical protein
MIEIKRTSIKYVQNFHTHNREYFSLPCSPQYVRLEILMVVKMLIFFWVVMPWGLVGKKHNVSIFRVSTNQST